MNISKLKFSIRDGKSFQIRVPKFSKNIFCDHDMPTIKKVSSSNNNVSKTFEILFLRLKIHVGNIYGCYILEIKKRIKKQKKQKKQKEKRKKRFLLLNFRYKITNIMYIFSYRVCRKNWIHLIKGFYSSFTYYSFQKLSRKKKANMGEIYKAVFNIFH